MKIKLPTALRSALLAAMAITATTVYADPFDPSLTPQPTPSETLNGLLVGQSECIDWTMPNTVTTVRGDVVVGAGNRLNSQVQGGKGTLIIKDNLHVKGSIYAGASGNTSFAGYVDRQGADGSITVKLDAGKILQVDDAIRLGWFDSKKGYMAIEGGNAVVGGQIVLGFYNEKGGPSLDTWGSLEISSAATVEVGREIFVASGLLKLVTSGKLTGTHLELVGLNLSEFTVNSSQASFTEILVGSHGNLAKMALDQGSVSVGQDFQIYGGTLELKNGSTLCIAGDAMFGDKSEGSIDSVISVQSKSTFTSKTLAVWKDAQLEIKDESSLVQVNGAARMDGKVMLSKQARLKVSSDLSLNDGAEITLAGTSSLNAQRTFSAGEVSVTLIDSSTFCLGDALEITSGTLTLTGKGQAGVMALTTAGNLIVGSEVSFEAQGTTSVAAGSSIDVKQNATVSLNTTGLSGNLAVAGTANVTKLGLNEGCGLTVSSSGKLTVASTTTVNASMALENTGRNGGTLGELSVGKGIELDLKAGNKANYLKATDSKVTVSGQGNQLGPVVLGMSSSLWVKGTGTEANGLTTAMGSSVNVDSDLTITGSTLALAGATTISGSFSAGTATWQTGNAPVTLLINGNTKSSSTDSMWTLQSGITSDTFNVQIDMKNGISDLSGKQVVFAKNGSEKLEFNKTAENFSFLTDGTVTEERGESQYVKIVQTIGSAKTTYGYTLNDGNYVGTTGTDWKSAGITFDSTYTNQYNGADDQSKSSIVIGNAKVSTEQVSEIYDKADFAGRLGDDVGSSIVSKNTGGKLKVGTQVVKLITDSSGGDAYQVVGTGAKTWEVSETTSIEGKGSDKTLIGGLTEESIDDIKVEQLGQLNISSGKRLKLEKASVTIGQTLSMGEGSSISAKGSKISIGTEDVSLTDVSFEVPRYENGQLVVGPDGKPVMEKVTLSQELTQKTLRNVSLDLEGSTFSVDGFDVFDKEQGSKKLASSQGITFENATVVTKQAEEGSMEVGTKDGAPMTFKNSSVSGTGTLTNIVMEGGMLGVGNSPGTLYVNKSDFNSTALRFFIDPSKVDATHGMAYGPNDNITSSLNFFAGGVTSISGVSSVSIQLQINSAAGQANSANANSANYVNVTDDAFTNQYSSHFVDGMTFQVINQDSLKNVSFTGTLVDGSLPTLQDGLVWDYSKLFTAGTIGIAKGSYADAARIANTLVSAGETVSGFGQMSRSHVYDVRLNGTNVWANGLGTFLNHSSHNGRTGFEYNAGGYAVGADTIVDDKAIVGVAFGQSFGKHTPKAGNRFFDAGHVDMDSLMFGLYGGTSFNMKSPSDSMKLDAYASYGRFDNDSTHRSLSGNQTATASWKENAYAVGATLTRVHEVRENLFFSPFASLDYIYADMDSFTETAAQPMRYEGSAYQNLSLSLGAGLTRVYRLNGGQELSPFVSVAYVGDLIRKDGKVTSKNATGALVERSVSPGRNAFQVNVGTGWKITEQWGARAGYTAEFRSGATDQGVTVGVNYAF